MKANPMVNNNAMILSPTKRFLCCFLLLGLLHYNLFADVVVLNNGEVADGTILKQDDNSILFKLDYGTITYLKSAIKSIKTNAVPAYSNSEYKLNKEGQLPQWDLVVSKLSQSDWTHSVKQIPATVIDQGILKFIPYISFRCNAGTYQMNVYGDLDSPVAIDIGTLKYGSEEAKTNCFQFIESLFQNSKAKEIIPKLSLNQKSFFKLESLTFETTLPTEADAYGFWWISVYNESALEKSRVTEKDLLTISELQDPPKKLSSTVSTPASVSISSGNLPAYKISRIPSQNQFPSWSREELSQARSGGGRVFVRGYRRKDGTYVKPHTRRR
ncbi:MAG: hypothetical protein ACO1QB_10780 [Verrucomicrobiales bacterium]